MAFRTGSDRQRWKARRCWAANLEHGRDAECHHNELELGTGAIFNQISINCSTDLCQFRRHRMAGATTWALHYQVSFQWKNPDFLLKNPDFLLKNVDFIIKQGATLRSSAAVTFKTVDHKFHDDCTMNLY